MGYSDFDHFRCFIDICETESDAQFNATFAAFAIPNSTNEEDRACLMYPPINPKGLCEPDNFDVTKIEACNRHVFSNETPYQHSLVEFLDLPPCKQMEGWPLKVLL